MLVTLLEFVAFVMICVSDNGRSDDLIMDERRMENVNTGTQTCNRVGWEPGRKRGGKSLGIGGSKVEGRKHDSQACRNGRLNFFNIA